MPRVSEKRVGIAVLNILAGRPEGEATVEVLKVELPKHIALSADDQIGSTTRTNEELSAGGTACSFRKASKGWRVLRRAAALAR